MKIYILAFLLLFCAMEGTAGKDEVVSNSLMAVNTIRDIQFNLIKAVAIEISTLAADRCVEEAAIILEHVSSTAFNLIESCTQEPADTVICCEQVLIGMKPLLNITKSALECITKSNNKYSNE